MFLTDSGCSMEETLLEKGKGADHIGCTLWFSKALGSAEPVAFQKKREFLRDKNPRKKRPEISENVVRDAKKKQPLERNTPAISRALIGTPRSKFLPPLIQPAYKTL